MGLSKIDLIRIKAYAVKVRNGMPLDEVPEKYRDAVSSAAGAPINQRPQPPMANQADKDYAAAVKAAIQKEQSPASGE